MLSTLPAGCVLVTFKSRFSVPPYRIENRTSDVVVYFAQSAVRHDRGMWNWLTPEAGGSHMAYAWDEPTQEHSLQVQASTMLITRSAHPCETLGMFLQPCTGTRWPPIGASACCVTASKCSSTPVPTGNPINTCNLVHQPCTISRSV